MEGFNEVVIMLCVYHLIMFSSFIPSPETRWYIGYSIIAIVAAHFIISILVIVVGRGIEIKNRCKQRLAIKKRNKEIIDLKAQRTNKKERLENVDNVHNRKSIIDELMRSQLQEDEGVTSTAKKLVSNRKNWNEKDDLDKIAEVDSDQASVPASSVRSKQDVWPSSRRHAPQVPPSQPESASDLTDIDVY